jgi:hypothetical protein
LSETLANMVEPQNERRGRGSNIYRNIVLGVLTVAAIATVALLGTLTFYVVSDHRTVAEAEAEAKKTEVHKSDLAAQVTSGLQDMFDSNEDTKDYAIQFNSDLTLFQLVDGGSEYRGLVTAKTKKGTEVPVLITVYADGTGPLVYQMDPPSNLRLTQIAGDEEPKPCDYYSVCE